jgi:hypothetical protein
VHRIHNRVAGNFYSATVGCFQTHWKDCWRKDYSMPVAVINDAHLDFTSRYQDFQARVAGFTNTKNDSRSVKAFKFCWSVTGQEGVQMMWKENADNSDRWLGENFLPLSPGFFMLPQLPPGRPKVIEPQKKIMDKKHIRELTSPAVLRQLKAHLPTDQNAQDAVSWLRSAATKGAIPYDLVEAAGVPGSWGPQAKVGIPGMVQGDFFVMRDHDHDGDEFWKLPEDVRRIVDADIQDRLAARRLQNGAPLIRYANISPAHAEAMLEEAKEAERAERAVSGRLASRVAEHDHKAQPSEAKVQWGADFKGCKVGWFAVVHTKYGEEGQSHGGSGVEIYSVKEIIEDKDTNGCHQFLPRAEYLPSGKVSVTDPNCLTVKWGRVPSKPKAKQNAWSVVHYFQKWTQGGKIPTRDQGAILDKARSSARPSSFPVS